MPKSAFHLRKSWNPTNKNCMQRSKTILSILTSSGLTVFQNSDPSWQGSLSIDLEAQWKYRLLNLGRLSAWENSIRIPGRNRKNSGWEERHRCAGATRLGQVIFLDRRERTRAASESGKRVSKIALFSLPHFGVVSEFWAYISVRYVVHSMHSTMYP